MDNFNYDTYCGIYCGACDIMMAHKTGMKFKLASFWDESTVKTFQKKLGIPYDSTQPFTYKCNGCKSGNLFVNCSVCQIRKCAINTGVEHCIDCGKYPCNLIVDSQKMASLLPHLKCNRTNMEIIQSKGVGQWLAEQESKCKCPDCQTSFSWYSGKCKNCGTDLRKYTYKFSFLKAAILKTGIRYLPFKQKAT